MLSIMTALKQEQIILKLHEFLNESIRMRMTCFLFFFHFKFSKINCQLKTTQVLKTDHNKVKGQPAQY